MMSEIQRRVEEVEGKIRGFMEKVNEYDYQVTQREGQLKKEGECSTPRK